MTPGWERATRWWATELADALGVIEPASMPELLAQVRQLRASQRLTVLELAERQGRDLAAIGRGRRVTVSDAARMANVSPRTILDWERAGLPLDRVRGRKRHYVNVGALALWLAHNRPTFLAAAAPELRAAAAELGAAA